MKKKMRNRQISGLSSFILILLLSWLPVSVSANTDGAIVAIIIDDIGDNLERGQSVIDLPGAVTVSVLPHKKYSRKLAISAHNQEKEVMLHLPMQPRNVEKDMGPGGLKLGMSYGELIHAFRQSLESVPYAVGINNHMGSLLTSHAAPMNWLMHEIKLLGDLYFVDSRTHYSSVANFVAAENELQHTKRDIFLDHVIDIEQIEYQFTKLLKRAQTKGFALAIGHPHEETLEVLLKWLPKLDSLGVRLVPVSQYINLEQQREQLWHASLSRSPKGVKN